MKQPKLFSIVSLSSLVLVMACGGAKQESAEIPELPPAQEPAPVTEAAPAATEAAPAAEAPAPKTVEVALQAKSNSKLAGKATFTETADGVKVSINVEGISAGDHATHVHETGDCSAPDAKTAGGHFNPGGHQHALPATAERHLGDLGNITVGKDGKGTHEITVPGANLKEGDKNSYLGKAIIVHEKKDDGGQPVGNAGGRIGCGEIK
jgi:Cu-Zn family superoxide dismutase